MTGDGDALLEVRGATKRYGGLIAVNDVSFSVQRGEIFGIAGPNGAGKTTLFDVVTGMVRATSGEIAFEGVSIARSSVHAICHRGITRTFQKPSVFDSETVMGNVVVGAHFGSGKPWWKSLARDPGVWDRSAEALALVGLSDRADERSGELPVFDKKRLMIASALASSPKMLFLDEPFGGLNDAEIDALLALLQRINREQGITIVLIEHVMRALMTLADRVLIMDQGRTLRQGDPHTVMTDPEVVRVYLGSAAEETASTAAIKVAREEGRDA
ncbi:ABC transporter ATP-binding protein [Leucobacter allii]|uniref:ABC transporter ATP-binding protein n=1 Tax=Leucobacter allii TaxID=2932247 RepID=A0ABY4FMM3_9MICO|nr:ABC transporter ATP-binding protein [Leucobacter allii]UOQ57511.1 ABC transporter ATP-binding protein [Leucobacter allii]UOR01971.1 ABC transporter ATP-binding protein [Leucobacter allii]